MSVIDARLKALGITLSPPPKPVASYVPFTKSGNLVFISARCRFPMAR
jgi:enamine deaminase RidA (YjgF/YER057c/UK114 family)